MKKLNKLALGVAIAAASLGLSTVTTAAETVGNLTFTFSGNIPALSVANAGWSFVDASDSPYVAPSAIPFSAVDTETGVQLISSSEEFYIQPKGGSFTLNSKIKAVLVAQPVISGTAVNASHLNQVETAVTLNGVDIPVGGEGADVVSFTAQSREKSRLVLGAQVDIPTVARSQSGGVIRLTTALRLSADIKGGEPVDNQG